MCETLDTAHGSISQHEHRHGFDLMRLISILSDLGHEALRVTLQATEAPSVWSVLCLEGELVCGDGNGCVSFWDAQFGSQLCSFKKHEADVTVMRQLVQKDVHYVLTSGADASVMIFQKRDSNWEYVHVRRPHVHDIHSLVIFGHGKQRTLMTGSEDCLVRFVSCPSDGDIVQAFLKKRLRTLDLLPEKPQFQLICHTSKRILIASSQKQIDFWHIPNDPDVDPSCTL